MIVKVGDSLGETFGNFVGRLAATLAVLTPIVNGGGKVDHMGGSIVGLRLSTFRENVRLSVQQECH